MKWLDRENGVLMKDGKYCSKLHLVGKDIFWKNVFGMPLNEGERLWLTAGVSYHVGREGKEVYAKKWKGYRRWGLAIINICFNRTFHLCVPGRNPTKRSFLAKEYQRRSWGKAQVTIRSKPLGFRMCMS